VDPKNIVLHGDCLIKYRCKGVFIVGCSPAKPHPAWAIVDRKNYTEIGPGLRERMAKDDPFFEAHLDKLNNERKESARKAG